MAGRISKRRILKAVREDLRQEREAGLQTKAQNFLNNCRRQRVVRRSHEQIFRQALAAAKIDVKKIERQQTRDLASMRKFREEQRESVLARAGARVERQRRIAERVQRQHDGESVMGNPNLIGFLILADDIEYVQGKLGPANFSRSQSMVSQTTYVNNIAEVDASVYTSETSFGYHFVVIDFHFIWQSSRAGVLTSVAGLQMNGGWQLENPPNTQWDNSARVAVEAGFRVRQTDLSGAQTAAATMPTQSILDKSVTGGGKYGYVYYDELTPFSDQMDLTAPLINIVDGYPVIFTVSVIIWAEAYWGADAEVDLRTGPFQINVPMIIFTV